MKTPNVVSLSAQTIEGRALRLTIGTEIMDHYEPVQTLGRDDVADADAFGRFQRRMIAIPDRRAAVISPMVLTISTSGKLYLLRQDANSEGGWLKLDLSPSFAGQVGAAAQVHAIGAGWTEDDRITLAVAVDDGTGQNRSRLFMAYDLTTQTSDWDAISWVDCGTRDTIRIEGLRVLPERDRTWTTVIMGDRGPNDMLYLLRSNLKQTFGEALVFNPAVTMETIFDFEVGVHPIYGGGVHLLGTSGRSRVLTFRPFPRYNPNGSMRTIPPVIPLPCPSGATVLESGMTRRLGSDLYIAGEGIDLLTATEFGNGAKAKLATVAGAASTPGVEDIVVGDQPDGRVAVWALLRNGDLTVVKRQGKADWQPALILRHGVQAIAPVQGDAHSDTSVLVVYSDYRPALLCQDAATQVWQEQPLLVASPTELHQTTCYGTKLRVLDEFGLPCPNVSVSVSASVLSSVRINKNAVFIGPGLPFTVQTDENGSIALLDRVTSLTPAIYRFALEGVEQVFDVNPATEMQRRFETLTVDELMKASVQTPQGQQPLLPTSLGQGDRTQVEAVVAVLQQTAQLARVTGSTGICSVAAAEPYSSALRTDAVPNHYRWGIVANAAGVQVASNSLIDKLSRAVESAADFVVNMGNSIADFFEGLGDRLQDGFALVVRKAERAFEVVCDLGGQVKRFALKTLQEAGAFFKWLWEQIKIGVERVRDFFKLILNWKDIVIVRDALVQCTDEVFQNLADSVEDLGEPVEAGFNQLLKEVGTWRQAAGAGGAVRPASSPLASSLKTLSTYQRDLLDTLTGNPAFTWVNERIEDLMAELAKLKLDDLLPSLVAFEGGNPLAPAGDAAVEFLTALGSEEASILMESCQQIQADLAALFEGQAPSPFDLSLDTLKNLAVTVGANALEAMLKSLSNLIQRSLKLVSDMVLAVRGVMFVKVRLPWLEKLVKWIAPGTSFDSAFSLIDGLMLLLAVPVTTGYKLFFKEAPLQAGEKLVLPWQSLFPQSGSDLVRKGARLSGLLGAFFGPIVTKVKVFQSALEFAETKDLAASYSPGPQILTALVAGVACTQDILSSLNLSSPNLGKTISSLRWTLVAISGVNLLNQTALLVPKAMGAKKTPGFDKVSAVLEVACFSSHLVMQTTIYSLATDHNRRSNEGKGQTIADDSLTFSKNVFDRSGLSLLSTSRLVKNPKAKLGLLVAGGMCRDLALLTELSRIAFVQA